MGVTAYVEGSSERFVAAGKEGERSEVLQDFFSVRTHEEERTQVSSRGVERRDVLS